MLKQILRLVPIALAGTLILAGCFPRFPNPQSTSQMPPASTDPSFSPDGSRILFVATDDGDAEVYVVNADGTGRHALTDNDKQDFFPSWSPDGSSIVFSSNRSGSFELYMMDVDGGNQRLLVDAQS